jgi:hypothetical protein
MANESAGGGVEDAMRAIKKAWVEGRVDDMGERYRAGGRDVWIFQKQGAGWVAVWRTMMDLSKTPA